MFIDSHTHPYLSDDPAEFIQRALAAGVDKLIVPNVDLSSIQPMYKLADNYPAIIYPAMGLHPTEVKSDAYEVLSSIKSEFDGSRDFVAVGEVGIDLYWDDTYRNLQMEIFDRQLEFARLRKLPVIIHCRNGLNETMEVLQNHPEVRAVFHSFGGSVEDVERIMSTGGDYYFGINGIVTFKNSNLRDVIPAIPADRIMLETDSPYLAPVPYRGKTNQSSYLPYIANAVANSLGKSVMDIAHITSENTVRFFNLNILSVNEHAH